MGQGLMPLEPQDYSILGLDWNQLFEATTRLSARDRFYIEAVTDRLHTVAWLSNKLDSDIASGRGPVGSESLLSLQIYLLLTCADIAGHILLPRGGAENRFREFFEQLNVATKTNLTCEWLVWKASWADLSRHGLADIRTRRITLPTRAQIDRALLALKDEERLKSIIDFLYSVRRHRYTHEGDYPTLGYHPSLSVLQMLRLGVENVADLGELNRIQVEVQVSRGKKEYYFAYLTADDPVSSLRQIIVAGLAQIIHSLI